MLYTPADTVGAVDSAGMLDDVLAQPQHLRDALIRAEAAALRQTHAANGLLVCGMGGSAIGADLAAAAMADCASGPIRTSRGYTIAPWVDEGTTVLCASYSGNTEETLSSYLDAHERRLPLIALTTGGELAQRARRDGVPMILLPTGLQPRAAVAYMTVGVLEAAASVGAIPPAHEAIIATIDLLESLAWEWRPRQESEASRLAGLMHRTVPVIYGAGPMVAVANRWKCQVNENAKAPAYHAALPEADHNEVCAYVGAPEVVTHSAVFLDDPALDSRVRRRIEVTAQIVADSGASTQIVEGRGSTLFERVLSLVLLGDAASVYLAAAAGVDPTPVTAIDWLKAQLATVS